MSNSDQAAAQPGKARKLPANNLAMHDMFKRVADKLKEKEKAGQDKEERPMGAAKFEEHLGDFFHPENIYNQTRNFPVCPSSANAAKLEAERLFNEGKQEEAAKLLLLSQANTFQHQVLLQYSKKLARQAEVAAKKPVDPDRDMFENSDDSEETYDEKQKRLMLFQSFDKTDVIDRMSSLPPTWTVVQICGQDPLVNRFKATKKDLATDSNPGLVLVRLQSGQVRVSMCPGPNTRACTPYMKEFQEILAENTHINRNEKVKSKYWELRRAVDFRMDALLRSMENKWLGAEKISLLGLLKNPKDQLLVKSVLADTISTLFSERETQLLESVLSSSPFLSPSQLSMAISQAVPTMLDTDITMLEEAASTRLSGLASSPRHPVILICDNTVQSLPWESLPSLKSCCQAVSRVPSLPFLHSLWSAHSSDTDSVVTAGVAQDSVFYVVNPDKSLPETQERLDKAFKVWSNWEGVAGEEPSKGQWEKALQGKDAFMYCGHGSGSKYLSGDEVEKLRVRAVPCLMGCSSGQLSKLGRTVDPLGTAQSYLLAASPALLGFLWPVTDADVDQWTVTFLGHWLGGGEGGEGELLQAAADKRKCFRNVLNGSALVVYGLPLRAKGKMGAELKSK
eukprot:GFUD01019048.1.p1 GENE.GFUD01019048.1~~GFUD01019048.1.p1  ORF type:complete len:623 (-),score=233.49 GFUD01019048.1:88-1956(-)